MLEAVLVFGIVSAIFEATILLKLPNRIKLRLLGSRMAVGFVHIIIILSNLFIHWGTMTGSMTAVVAGLASFIIIPLVRHYVGYIKNRRYYPGVKRYALAELK